MSRRNSLIDPSTIRAFGPGLKGGRVGEECKFRIEGTDGGLALSFHIEGPSRPIFETCAGKDLSLDIAFIPLMAVSSAAGCCWLLYRCFYEIYFPSRDYIFHWMIFVYFKF